MDYTPLPFYARDLCLAVAVSAILTIVATARGWKRGVYVFKPLTTLLVIAVALNQENVLPPYKSLIVAGLVFSLAGDVFLMLPGDRFVAGLVAFLVAHVLYTWAFVQYGFAATWWIVLTLVAYAAVLLRVLLPHVEARLKLPVAVYAAALLVMAWQALERGFGGSQFRELLAPFVGVSGERAALGALLFVASDSALAVNRFVRHFRGADAVVLATYYAAQTLIALSIT